MDIIYVRVNVGRLVHGGGWRFLWVGGLGGGIFWEVVGG